MFKSKNYLLLSACLFTSASFAEIIVDTSLPTAAGAGEISAVDNNFSITEENGSLVETNLFFSFEKFNIGASETATFTAETSGIKNIISRVTGGGSVINGGIISEIPDANLRLINPKGILFGENASLDLQGSFHASTADSILMQNDIRFNALNEANVLTASPPKSFGFLDPSASTAKLSLVNVKLTVKEGSSITLLGSDVNLSGSLLSAPGGNISVVSISEAGDIIYSDLANEALDVSSIENLGHLSIDSTAFTINGDQKGRLEIKGDDIEINSRNTDFLSSVTDIKTRFFEDENLLEKPCELAEFYNQGKMTFTLNLDEDETEYGVKTKKTQRGPIGLVVDECL